MKLNYFLIAILFFGCSPKKQDTEIKELIRNKLNTTLILPNSKNINLLHSDKFYDHRNNNLKIVTYIDGDCSLCVEELQMWKRMDTILCENEVDLIFYFYSRNHDQLIDRLSSINFKYYFLIDSNDSFIKQNNLSYNKLHNTFLIDHTNTILLIGNPLYGRDLYLLYESYILENKHHANSIY